jgi:hypothetical protein
MSDALSRAETMRRAARRPAKASVGAREVIARLGELSRRELLVVAAEALRASATRHNAPLPDQCDAMTLVYAAEKLAQRAR